MAIVQPIREDTFVAMMHGHSISDRGLKCLFRHLEICSEEADEDVLFDAEALLTEFIELSLEDMREYYGDLDGYPIHGNMETVAEWTAEHTCVVYHNETHILFGSF